MMDLQALRRRMVEVGDTYGSWSVIGFGERKSRVRVRCICGTENTVLAYDLRAGKTMQCRNCNPKPSTTHGMSYDPVYKSWIAMKVRTSDPKTFGYEYYGGKGVKVCERWLSSFEAFLEDMGPRPEGTSLDRIDVNGDYEPANCRWATRAQQSRNTTRSHYITFNGETLVLEDWAERLGIWPRSLRGRLKRGWPLEKALTLKPVKKNGRVVTLAERSGQ